MKSLQIVKGMYVCDLVFGCERVVWSSLDRWRAHMHMHPSQWLSVGVIFGPKP